MLISLPQEHQITILEKLILPKPRTDYLKGSLRYSCFLL